MSYNSNLNSGTVSKTFITILVLSLLTLFPMFAVYMSSSGLKANKSLKSEMKSYKDSIKLPDVKCKSLLSENDLIISQTNDKVIVLSFLDTKQSDNSKQLNELKRVQSEFIKKTKRIKILTIVENWDKNKNFQDYILSEKIDSTSWEFINSDSIIGLFNSLKVTKENAWYTLVLVDRKGIVANMYNINQRENVNNLMRHATMLLPAKEDRRKIKFKRESEIYN